MSLFGKKNVFTYGSEDNKKEKIKPEPASPLSQSYESGFAEPDDEPKRENVKRGKKEREPRAEKDKSLGYASRISARLIIGVGGIVVALFLLFVLSPLVTRMANEEMGTAVRAVSNIPKGTLLDTANLEIIEVPQKSIPNNAIQAIKEITGFFAATDISAGDYVLASKLSENLPFKDEYLYTMPEEMFAMSVKIKSFENGLAGKLLSGDIVSVYASMSMNGQDDSYLALAPPELRYVYVLSVTTGNGNDYDRNKLEESVDNNKDSELPVTVELLVFERQARALAGLNQNAVIHLALVSRGSPEYEEHLLDFQREFLEQQAAEEAVLVEAENAQGQAVVEADEDE